MARKVGTRDVRNTLSQQPYMKSWVVLRKLGCRCHDSSCSENICHEIGCLCKRVSSFLSRSIVVLALFFVMKPFCATVLLVALHWLALPSCAHRQLPFSDAVPSDTSVRRDPSLSARSMARSPISRSQAPSPSRTCRTSAVSKIPLPRLILRYSECRSTPR